MYGVKYDLKEMELGKRLNDYRAWIYFTDKTGSSMISIDKKTAHRRKKNNVLDTSSRYDLSVSHKYVAQITSLGVTIKTKSRKKLINFLNEKNIPTMVYYPISMHMQPAYKKYATDNRNFVRSINLANSVFAFLRASFVIPTS